MFFKNLKDWTDKQLRLIHLLFYILYFGLTLLAPIIVIATKYKLFEKVSGYKLTGVGLIVALIVAVVGFSKLASVISKLPENEKSHQMLKYNLQLVMALIIPLAIRFVLLLFRDNFMLAYDTVCWCVYFILAGIVVNYTCIKYLDHERDLRNKADEAEAIQARMGRKKK